MIYQLQVKGVSCHENGFTHLHFNTSYDDMITSNPFNLHKVHDKSSDHICNTILCNVITDSGIQYTSMSLMLLQVLVHWHQLLIHVIGLVVPVNMYLQ